MRGALAMVYSSFPQSVIVTIFCTGFTVLKIFGKRKESFLKKLIFRFLFSGNIMLFFGSSPPLGMRVSESHT